MVIGTAQDAARLFAPLFAGARGERLAVMHLDRGQRLLGLHEEAGHASTVDLPLRTIIAAALARGTASLVLAHNHPGGDPTPSRADIAATRQLADVAGALGIRLHDHLIFADGGCLSFRQMGLL